jgi:tetratricopeptide (TPR) repeat protein
VFYQRGEYEQAVEYLEQAVVLSADDPTIAEHLGDAYRELGRQQEAIRKYRDALSRSPEEDQASRIRGKIEALQGAVLRSDGEP